MAINISSLKDYIAVHPELLLTSLYQDLTIKRVMVYDVSGIVPGLFSARFIEANGKLQPCCTIPTNGSTVTERISEAVCILDGDEYCEEQLSQVLSNAASELQRVRFTAGNEDAGSIEQIIIDEHRAAFVDKLEILSWQGDKTSADTDLNRTDGLLTIGEQDGATMVDITSGNAFQALNAAVRALSPRARKMARRFGIGVFVPEEFAESYWEVAMYLNLYHYNPGDFNYGDDLNVIGKSGMKIIPTPGLNGTNKIMVTPIKNIVWFNSRREDHNTLDWDYDKYQQKYYWRVKTIFGVNLIRPDMAVIAEYDESILTNGTSVNVSIVAPLANNGGVLTGDTAPAAPAASPASAQVAPAKATKAAKTTRAAKATKADSEATSKDAANTNPPTE